MDLNMDEGLHAVNMLGSLHIRHFYHPASRLHLLQVAEKFL